MSPSRSTIDRRRRVLYASAQDDSGSSTAASRRETQRLREARRPQAMYAERVQRRLQGRWFSLVPVQGRTFAIAASVIAAATILLVMMHYLAVTWPRLVDAPEIARPLRLDRADSFGRRYLSFLLAASAGVALLIYQLRRYRIDDYRGQYRLWRTVLLTLAVASVGVSVSLVDWTGSVLDAVLGRRVALSGADWVRLLVSMGGFVLMLRLIAETYRCRFTLCALAVALAGLILPEAAGWNLFVVDTASKWAAITAGPLVGCTALFLGIAAYLRLLYREVCEIEDGPSLREQISNIRMFSFAGQTDEGSALDDSENNDDEPAEVVKKIAAKEEVAAKDEDLGTKSEPKVRWWHRKKKEKAMSSGEDDGNEIEEQASSAGQRKSATADSETSADTDSSDSENDSADPPQRKSRFGLGGFLKRKKPSAETQETELDDQDSQSGQSEHDSDVEQASAPRAADDDDDEVLDADSIDWNSLSKTERRRLRKQLKRQNRAA